VTVKAIYENGVFKPTEPVALEERTEVDLEIKPVTKPSEDDDDPTGWNAMDKLIGFIKEGPRERLGRDHDEYLYK
jgi:predicted DNA-binding antitoxin AbrB/MazE fold protein